MAASYVLAFLDALRLDGGFRARIVSIPKGEIDHLLTAAREAGYPFDQDAFELEAGGWVGIELVLEDALNDEMLNRVFSAGGDAPPGKPHSPVNHHRQPS